MFLGLSSLNPRQGLDQFGLLFAVHRRVADKMTQHASGTPFWWSKWGTSLHLSDDHQGDLGRCTTFDQQRGVFIILVAETMVWHRELVEAPNVHG